MSIVAVKTGSGNHPDNKEEERMSAVTVKPTLSTPRYVAKDRYVTWTTNEALGFDQSIDDKVKYGDSKAEMEITPSRMVGEAVGEGASSRRSRRKTKKFSSSSSGREGFPPLLSTLNINGRPSYDFVRRTENGRLQIQMVPNEHRELVATVHESGRLMLSFVNCEHEDWQDDDDKVQEGCIGTVKDHEESNEVEIDGSYNGGDKEEEVHGEGNHDDRSLT